MSHIVVSDVHLGSKLCNFNDFCDFVEWILDLKDSSKAVPCEDETIEIKSPEKIVLLGDILEMWDPIDGDRDNVVKQSLRPFSLLSNVNCDKIYVTGNHDNALCSYDEKIDCEMLCNKTKLNIWDRHYPDEEAGIRIGERSYYFLHGHQYDKSQAVLAWVSKLIGESWDPLNWFNAQYNITFTKRHWTKNFLILVALVAAWYHERAWLTSSFLYTIPLALLTGFLAVSSIPGIVTKSQRRIYDFNKPRDKNARQILKEKFYKEQKDTITADVVVFGHTHFASSYKSEAGKKKLFINSGSWVGRDEEIDGKTRYTNTFVYIDDGGAYILRWHEGDVECIEAL